MATRRSYAQRCVACESRTRARDGICAACKRARQLNQNIAVHVHEWSPWKMVDQVVDARGPTTNMYSRVCATCREMESETVPARM